jgi:hypothetical protein
MTFPQDHMHENIKAEEHSVASIAVVSAVMIAAAMFSLVFSL